MRKIIAFGLLAVFAVVSINCTDTDKVDNINEDNGTVEDVISVPNGDNSSDSPTAPSTPPSKNDEERTEIGDPLPSGTIAILLTLRMDSRTESWPTGSGTVSWSETGYGLFEVLPEVNIMNLLASTTSYSFSSGYVYPLTVKNYMMGVNTRSLKQITIYDPQTGKRNSSGASVSSNDEYRGFAVVEDKIYFVDNYGDLVVQDFPGTGGRTILLKNGDHEISGRYIYSIDGELISVNMRTPGQYSIQLHDKTTGLVRATLLTLGQDEIHGTNFFAGDDAMYWPVFDENNLEFTVFRYILGGTPQPVITRQLTSKLGVNLAIDESRGKVLLVYRDGTPASNGPVHFNLYDTATETLQELDLGSSLFSSTIFGTQLFVIE